MSTPGARVPGHRLLAVVTAVDRASMRAGAPLSRAVVAVQGPARLEPVGAVSLAKVPELRRSIDRRVEALTLDRFGRRAWLRPECVVELEVAGARRTRAMPCGWQLRGARLVAVREELLPDAVADLRAVEELAAGAVRARAARPAPRSRATRPVEELPLFAPAARRPPRD